LISRKENEKTKKPKEKGRERKSPKKKKTKKTKHFFWGIFFGGFRVYVSSL